MPSRIRKDNLYFSVAKLVGKRSTCPRAEVGAILVKEGRIITMGYNGAPSKQPHCLDVGCDLVTKTTMPEGETHFSQHCQRAVHAEANAIAWAARAGVSLLGSHLYCTHEPCLECAKLLINAGVAGVHWVFPTWTGISPGPAMNLFMKAKVLLFEEIYLREEESWE